MMRRTANTKDTRKLKTIVCKSRGGVAIKQKTCAGKHLVGAMASQDDMGYVTVEQSGPV